MLLHTEPDMYRIIMFPIKIYIPPVVFSLLSNITFGRNRTTKDTVTSGSKTRNTLNSRKICKHWLHGISTHQQK